MVGNVGKILKITEKLFQWLCLFGSTGKKMTVTWKF